MAANSPFSRLYRNLINESGQPQSSYNKPYSPLSIQQHQRGAFNIFEAVFETEGTEPYDKSEPKIKVFGMGDKKKKKPEKKQDYPQPSNQQLKFKAQTSHNLLESLESLPEDYCRRLSREVQEPERLDQLQRLLEISPDLPQSSELKTDSNLERKAQDNDSSNTVLRKSHYLQDPARQISSRIQLMLGKTDSCEVPPGGCERSGAINNNSFSCKSMNSSKIRDIFDHCSDLFNNQALPTPPLPDLVAEEKQREKQHVDQSQIIDSNQKKQHRQGLQHPQRNPRKQLPEDLLKKNSAVESKQTDSPIKKMSSPVDPNRPSIKISSQKNQKPKQQGERRWQKESKRGVQLKKYLSLDNHYSTQIDMMINRYQKMAELKEKKKEIKEELGKLAPKYHAAHRYDKHYYLPRYSNDHPPPNIDYHERKANNKQSGLFSSAPPTKRPLRYYQDEDEGEVGELEHPTELQRQLSMNVQNMQRIINKFKILSKQIANQSQEFVNSQIVYENTVHSVDKGQLSGEYLKSKISHKQSPTNQSLAQEELNRQFFGSVSSTKGLRYVSSELQPHNMPSSNMTDSIQQISISKQLARIQQRTNPYLTNQKHYPAKNTTRTEKKGSSATRGTPNLGWQTYNTVQECKHHYHCECDHASLAEQLSKINKKLQKLEKHQNPHLSHVKSEETVKHKAVLVPEYQFRVDNNSIESDQKEEINQSIPPREHLQYQQVKHKSKQSARHSAQKKKDSLSKKHSNESHHISPRHNSQHKKQAIENERANLQLDDEIMKKMKINFPVLQKSPSRNDSLSSLVSLGEYTFSILLKFVRSRGQKVPQKVKIGANLRVKKCIEYIHYSLPDCKYHLIYSFSGKLYFGSWSQEIVSGNGYKQGFGYYFKPKKYVYEGQFYLDRKHGKGLLNTAKGQIYEGDWAKGKKEGYGILINTVGDVYKGFFQGGKKSGKGEEQLANGDYYRGQFRKGKLNGQGVYVWADGSIYKGGFKNALLNGKGVWRSKDNDVYDGEYKDNKKHGKGTYIWSNGASFTGYFHEDQNTGERSQAATKEKHFPPKTPVKGQFIQREPSLQSKVKREQGD